MAKMYSASINVNKIVKENLFEGAKGKYLNLTIAINDEEDDYGNTMSVQQSLSQEEREAGASKNYLGNGKVVWSDEGDAPKKEAKAPADNGVDDESLPF